MQEMEVGGRWWWRRRNERQVVVPVMTFPHHQISSHGVSDHGKEIRKIIKVEKICLEVE